MLGEDEQENVTPAKLQIACPTGQLEYKDSINRSCSSTHLLPLASSNFSIVLSGTSLLPFIDYYIDTDSGYIAFPLDKFDTRR